MIRDLQIPARRRWTRAEYDRAIEMGVFDPDERLELIEGEIVEKTPQGPSHRTAVLLVEQALRAVFPVGHVIQVQIPLSLGESNEPEPDLAVVVGTVREHTKAHPSSAVLVVEVSDTSLAYDRGTKGQIYARAQIAEYWIVNLQDRLVEIYRRPAPMAEQPLGHAYRSLVCLGPADHVSPMSAPECEIAIVDMLP